MEGSLTNPMIIQAVNSVRTDPQWHGRWITAADWCELLRRSAPSVLASIDTAKLNQAIARSSLKHGFEVFDINPLGFLRRRHNKGGIITWCYFTSVPGSTVRDPEDGSPWYSNVRQTTPDELMRVVPVQVTVTVDTPSVSKRSRILEVLQATAWWDSKEARNIFATREDDASTNVQQVIKNRLTLLSTALSSATGYKGLVEGHDPDGLLSANVVFVLRLKAEYLHTALDFALKEWMPGRVTWGDCCEKAIAHMAATGVKYCKRAHTLADWHKHLRMNNTLPPSERHHNKLPAGLNTKIA